MWDLLKKIIRNDRQSGTAAQDRKTVITGQLDLFSEVQTYHISLILTITCRAVGHDDTFRLLTENVNTFGLRFVTPTRLEAGEIVEMSILLFSNSPAINVKGKITLCENKNQNGKPLYEGALVFVNLGVTGAQILEKYIARFSDSHFDTTSGFFQKKTDNGRSIVNE